MLSSRIGSWSSHDLVDQVLHARHLSLGLSNLKDSGSNPGCRDRNRLRQEAVDRIAQSNQVSFHLDFTEYIVYYLETNGIAGLITSSDALTLFLQDISLISF